MSVSKITSPITNLEQINKINEIIDNLGGTGATVDQTYDGTSANAQSGVAIAGANFIQNTATLNTSLTISGTASTKVGTVNVGVGTTATSNYAVSLGHNAKCSGGSGLALGRASTSSASYAVSLGYGATSSGSGALQLGYGTNSTANTLSVGFYNTQDTHYNWSLLNGATGLIPDARLSSSIARASDIPTETTVSGWGFTKNSGTVTSVNNVSPVNGNVSLTIPDAQIQSDWNQTTSSAKDYIKNKPTIPTVNNATLTITQGGVSKGTFTANASSNTTIALDAGGDSLPSQSGNAGKLLTTDGTNASWGATATIYPVIEIYRNNGSWYKIYAPDSTGYRWCEQGNCNYANSSISGDNSISFIKTFKDTNYTFIPQIMYSSSNPSSANGCFEKYTERTPSSTILRAQANWLGYTWIAYGYIANEVS